MAIAKCKKGFRLDRKKNRCVRVRKKSKGNPSRNSKSYNPFKMWGSWVGLVIIFLYSLVRIFNVLASRPDVIVQIGYLSYGLMIIVGFLIGWGIHSLIRRLR